MVRLQHCSISHSVFRCKNRPAKYGVGILFFVLMAYCSPGLSSSTTPTVLEIKRDPAVQAQLDKALLEKGKTYHPRTEHLDVQGRAVYTNRLILEDSPYLLQHAHNPVDWYPWGVEAFEKAKRENKPIFLSIGYSTCHWCHVMEKESFENLEIARVLNENFVAIKVDRERRPAVDTRYMTAVELLSGRGGWPLSSFLTPEGKPFFGGVYFPPDEFMQLLKEAHSTWISNQAELIEKSNQVAEAVAKRLATRTKAEQLDSRVIDDTTRGIMYLYDDMQGGFGQAPKFPNEPLLYFLLGRAERTGDRQIVNALEHTLDEMARGGIYDQIGGGFHRYSIDNAWLVPHFEKMLYNQAQLSRIYLRAWRLTGNPEFKRVARQTIDYVLREMTSIEGGFYSATDADSEGEEGRYFLWTPEQFTAVLEKRDAAFAMEFYGVSAAGNFEGLNILHMAKSVATYSAEHGLKPGLLRKRIDRVNMQLLNERHARVPPLRDDKIITAWNGMMISALAYAGDLLDEPEYLKAAIRAADLLWSRHYDQKKRYLLRSRFDQQATVEASQEDYAYLAESFLVLFDVTGKARWLQRAREITAIMITRFWDQTNGGFYMSDTDAVSLGMGRAKDIYDRAMPSGNSMAMHVLQKLSRRTDNPEYQDYAQQLISALAAAINHNPPDFAYLLSSVDELYNGETGARQFAAHGAVSVEATLTENQLSLDISIKPGWHINAHKPLQAYLVPTRIKLPGNTPDWHLSDIQYPQGLKTTLGFQRQSLLLYQGQLKLTAALRKMDRAESSNFIPVVEISLQACNDKQCLPPEALQLRPLIRKGAKP